VGRGGGVFTCSCLFAVLPVFHILDDQKGRGLLTPFGPGIPALEPPLKGVGLAGSR